MKKIGALVLALVMSISCSLAAFAEGGISEKELFDLKSLGILIGDDSGSVKLDEQVTKAEMASIVVRLLKLADTVDRNGNSIFSDVLPGEWYAGDVNLLYALGYVKGNPDGTYEPMSKVTYEQAVKLLVSVLGYDYTAMLAGGYPNGYLASASSIGLLKGVNLKDDLTRGDLAKLVYNALDIDIMRSTYSGENANYTIEKGDCLRKLHEGRADSYLKQRGIVTATDETWLVKPLPGLKADEVEINDIVYRVGQTDAKNLLGQEVDFYIQEDPADGRNTLTSIMPTNRNHKVVIDAELLEETSLNEIRYYEDEEQTQESSFELSDASIVYNRQFDMEHKAELLKIEAGTLTIIDNNGDMAGDIVFVDSVEAARVEEVGQNFAAFATGQTIAGEGKLSYEADNKEKKYTFVNRDGAPIEFSAIKKDDVLSAIVSKDKTVYRVTVSDKAAEGMVTELEEDRLTIDDSTYKFMPGKTPSVKVGENVMLFLDAKNRVVDIRRGDNKDMYGYIVKVDSRGGISDVKVKMLIPGKIMEDVEIDDSNEDNKVSTPLIKIRNESVKVFELASGIRIDGVRQDVGSLASEGRALIGCFRYKMNSQGQISVLNRAKIDSLGEKRNYNAYEKIFYETNKSAFTVSETSRVLCIPKNPDEISSDYDYLTSFELNNNQSYELAGYDVDQTTQAAAIIVAKIAMDYYAGGAINNSNKIAVANRVEERINDNGDAVKFVQFYSQGKEMQYQLSENCKTPEAQSKVDSLRVGDVFFYALNNVDEINDVKVMINVAGKSPYAVDGDPKGSEFTAYGLINNIRYNQISVSAGRRVHKLWLQTGEGDETEVEVNTRNMIPIYCYNRYKKTVEVIKAMDIRPIDQEIFMYKQGGNLKALVVVE